jgi:hypothetical protein
VASGDADARAEPGRELGGSKKESEPLNRFAVRESWAETQTRLAVASARDAEAREAALRRAEADAKAQAAMAAEERRRAADEVIELSGDEEDEAATALRGEKENESALAAARRRRREAYEAHVNREPRRAVTTNKEREKEKETFRNPLLDPPRYEPSAAPSAGDLRLSTDERAEIADVGLAWYPCSACLDTGNAGCTLIAQELATRMGLCDGLGVPTGGFAGYVEVRGVVAGAAERLAKVHVTYRIKGKTMRVWAGITRAGLGCDLLVSRNDIVEFERDGYTLSAR